MAAAIAIIIQKGKAYPVGATENGVELRIDNLDKNETTFYATSGDGHEFYVIEEDKLQCRIDERLQDFE